MTDIVSPAGRKTPDRPCTNCGDPTAGNYCRVCGQRKVEVRVSLRRMLMEALDDQFSLNSALPRTLGALFGRPGHLTREYMQGRIARYIPPFRLYLVGSLLFFLALSITLNTTTATGGRDGGIQIRADSAGTVTRLDSLPRENWLRNMRINTGIAHVDSLAAVRVRELGEMEPRNAMRRVGDQFLAYVPQTMFLLMPLYAGILKLLYIRRKRLYVEHFVFALHLHAFVFVTFTFMTLTEIPVLEGLALLWIVVYTYLAMYRVYEQGWFRTGIKYLALGFSYLTVMTMAMALTFLAAVVLM